MERFPGKCSVKESFLTRNSIKDRGKRARLTTLHEHLLRGGLIEEELIFSINLRVLDVLGG